MENVLRWSLCDVESLLSVGEGEGSFNSIVQPCQDEPIANVEERGVTEEDEEDEDGISFATLEPWFKNKETVHN